MALIFAGLGHLEIADWARLVDGAGDVPSSRSSGSLHRQVGDTAVRLAAVGPGATFREATSSGAVLAAAGSGMSEDGGDVASTVLDAYRVAGVSGLVRLGGEYVFALWDGRERSLLVGCDAVGLRAPAYVWDGRTFLASSRALSLARCAGAAGAFDPVYLAHAFGGLWSRSAFATPFAGIRRMMGGDILRVSSGGLERLSGDRFVFDVTAPRDVEGAARQLGERIDQVVLARRQGRRICVALSGGVDSCTVASSLAGSSREFDAFSLVAPAGSPGDGESLSAVVRAFPGLRHHPVELTGAARCDADSLPDDPICAGPVLQAARVALMRAARDLGFQLVFDGEGGDELFDLAWWPADVIRERARGPALSVLRSRQRRRSAVRDLALGGSMGLLSNVWQARAKRNLRSRRPWLRAGFWESQAFDSAWNEALSFGSLRSARERLPEILGAHGRYWRTQALARASLGLEGASPLLDRSVIEFVGSLPARIATDPRHRKALLRRLAAQRVPAAVAWRPKSEPLSAWLEEQFVSDDGRLDATLHSIRSSRMLEELVDTNAVLSAVRSARAGHGGPSLARALVELFTLVEWVVAVEARCRFSR